MGTKLKALTRDDHKGSATKQLRKSGSVPAVVYGKANEAQSISVNGLELLKTVRDEGKNAIITLEIENGKPVEVMLHDYQMDPVRSELVHVDFFAVDMSTELEVSVQIKIEGEAKGSKEGGVLQQPVFELQVRARPDQIPEEIVINVTDLNVGDVITVGDLAAGADYTFADDTDTPIVTILAPASEEEEETVVGSIEPEVIGEKDKDADKE